MKTLFLASLLVFPSLAPAAEKAKFSVFGVDAKFAEITCSGITGHPNAYTFRLSAMEDQQDTYEAYIDMIAPYKLIVAASAAANGRTLYLTFAREDASPVFSSTKGLDLALRIGSGLDVYCELNAGPQITKDEI